MADTAAAPVIIPDSPQNNASNASNSKQQQQSGGGGTGTGGGGSNKKKSTSLPSRTVEYLKAWMMSPEHVAHPYPTEQEKAQIMADTGIEMKQLTNWFVNNRKRYWKPRVEARLQQQQQAQAAAAAAAVPVSGGAGGGASSSVHRARPFLSLDMTQPVGIGHQVAISPALIGDNNHGGCASSQQQRQARHAFHHFNHEQDSSSVVGATSPPPVTLQHHHHHHNESSARAISVGSASSLASDSSSDNGSLHGGEHDDRHTTSNGTTTAVPPIVSMLHDSNAVEFSSRLGASNRNEDDEGHEGACTIAPHYVIENDTKKARYAQDVGVTDAKGECILAHIAAEESSPVDFAASPTKRTRAVSDSECSAAAADASNSVDCCSSEEVFSPPKRARRHATTTTTTTRTAFHGKNSESWKDACRNACHGYDNDALPTLEEAALLFGYAS